jgi:hypothetical protein
VEMSGKPSASNEAVTRQRLACACRCAEPSRDCCSRATFSVRIVLSSCCSSVTVLARESKASSLIWISRSASSSSVSANLLKCLLERDVAWCLRSTVQRLSGPFARLAFSHRGRAHQRVRIKTCASVRYPPHASTHTHIHRDPTRPTHTPRTTTDHDGPRRTTTDATETAGVPSGREGCAAYAGARSRGGGGPRAGEFASVTVCYQSGTRMHELPASPAPLPGSRCRLLVRSVDTPAHPMDDAHSHCQHPYRAECDEQPLHVAIFADIKVRMVSWQ